MKIYTHVYITITVIYFFAQVSWCEDLRKSEFLLPGNLIPSHYDVTWEFLDDCSNEAPDFRFEKNFTGDVRVVLTATEPNVTAIELNCFKLMITRAVILIGKGLEYLELRVTECDSLTGKVTLHSPIGLPTSRNLVLWVIFTGKIRRQYDHGIWCRTHYIGSMKPGQVLVKESIGTLFEPAAARQAFPCFDEPKYKATFRLSLNVSTCVIKKGYVLLGNTPLESVQEWPKYLRQSKVNLTTELLFSVAGLEIFQNIFKRILEARQGRDVREKLLWRGWDSANRETRR